MNKKFVFMLSMVSSLVIVTLIGTAYAYFSAGVGGDPLSTSVTAAVVAGVKFDGGQGVVIPEGGIYPGWKGVQSFTINKPTGITSGVGAYRVTLDTTVASEYGEWLTFQVYKVTDSSKKITRSEGVLTNNNGSISQEDELVFTNFTSNKSELLMGDFLDSSTGLVTIDEVNYDMSTFTPTTYYIVYNFLNVSESQNATFNKTFSATANVEIIAMFDAAPNTVNAAKYNELQAPVKSGELLVDEFGNTRYVGSDPNNYVTFNNETWRIVGTMLNISKNDLSGREARLKLVGPVKEGVAFGNTNDWVNSNIDNILNDSYYESLSDSAKSYIDTVSLNLGGSGIDTAKNMYINEHSLNVNYGNSVKSISYVSLLSASDYLYSIDNGSYLTPGDSEWTMTHDINGGTNVMSISNTLEVSSSLSTNLFTYRPVVYLSTDVNIVSGSGTSTDPYVLSDK